MGLLLYLFFLSVGVGTALIALVLLRPDEVYNFLKPLPPKESVLPFEDRIWTSSGKSSNSTEIRPFRVHVSDTDLSELKHRLKNTRYGSSMVDIQFTYGVPSDYLRKVVDYWLNKYDWRSEERILNQYPQYLTEIEGLDIHFVQFRPQDKKRSLKTYPIALFHGWPGSFFELYKLVPLLTKPRTISGSADSVAYELVIPSIPGFGYSQAAEIKGMDPCNVARIYDKLMQRLGHSKYFIYGGDWGSVFARCLSVMYPERILGMNLVIYSIPRLPSLIKTITATLAPSLVMDPQESYKLYTHNIGSMLEESGFTHIQSTKPETVGAALSDSPAGLAAYILGIFNFFTRPDFVNRDDGGLTDFYTLDELLTNVMIYWITNSIQSSTRIYKENCGYMGCGNAGSNLPSDFVKPYFKKLIKISTHPEGGHFSAMEKPDELAEDIWAVLTAVLQQML